ncbi:HAD-IB family phosphatase [Solitalea sp. MAHUQ-68]|uniref:phosphoserine phosphatase n=1 Tax=Solitalea agri TaxID=2953739 RepID=A0A9X2JCQ7_9SPHI|nr:HAD-IB family phosphatase [Solitalea agri]MCO4292794.1 HAD-IB family phosphatase [Solitalea agri]
MKNRYIIDFDSTFTQVEALDELVKISLKGHPDKDLVLKQIEDYTNAAMEGRMSFTDSLRERVKLLGATDDHLHKLVKVLKKKVSSSFSRNRKFFEKHADEVFIVSGGFKEFITPVVSDYRIKPENIYANTFEFNEEGTIVGYDTTNPLSQEGGKVKLLKQLNWEGNLYGIGDGYSDFQLKESGLIKKFFAYTENIARSSVVKNADHVLPSFDEFLYVNNLPMAISYPKNRILCLCIGDIPEEAIAILKKDGFSIRHKSSFEEKYVADVGMMLLGNGEIIKIEKLKRATTLKTIGYLGNAKEKLDMELCTKMGIVVFDDRKNNTNNGLFIPKRMADFINSGASYLSCNFPNIQLTLQKNAHRLIHIHHNVPGIMAQINSVMADHGINILAQYLKTNEQIGYVITDVNAEYDKKVIKALKKIEHTIKFRLLY